MSNRTSSIGNGKKTCPMHKSERSHFPRLNRSTSETPSFSSSSSSSRPAFTTSTKVPTKPGEYNVSRRPSGRSIPMSEQSHSAEVHGAPWFSGNSDTRSLISNRAPKTGYTNTNGKVPAGEPSHARKISAEPLTSSAKSNSNGVSKDLSTPKPIQGVLQNILKEITPEVSSIRILACDAY